MNDLYKKTEGRSPTREELTQYVIHGFHANYCVAVNKQFTLGMDRLLQGMNSAFVDMKQLHNITQLNNQTGRDTSEHEE